VKQSKPLLEVAVVLSSVLLVGAFVCYRAGAFNRFLASTQASAQPADSENNSTLEEALFGSSKSDRILRPPASQTPAGTTQQDPAIMYSSKSMILSGPPSAGTKSAPPPAAGTTPAAPTILPGSKSSPLVPLPGPPPPEKKPTQPPSSPPAKPLP
jgi:hypothetical protein